MRVGEKQRLGTGKAKQDPAAQSQFKSDQQMKHAQATC